MRLRFQLWCRLFAGTLAGPLEMLLALGPPPRRARRVVVWTRPDALLSEADRDRLWQAYHLPVFEEVHGPAGERLAFECEAHQGWHIDERAAGAEGVAGELVLSGWRSGVRLPTGEWGRLERGKCECGQEALRWIEEGERLTSDISYDILEDASR